MKKYEYLVKELRNYRHISCYKLEIDADWEFIIEYNGKKYNELAIIFKTKSKKLNTKAVLKTINKIKLVEIDDDFDLAKSPRIFSQAKNVLEELKNTLKNGQDDYSCSGDYGNYFTFTQISDNIDYIIDV